MGVSGRTFVAKHNDEVTDMMRLLLDFMKAARLRRGQNNMEDVENRDAGSGAPLDCNDSDVKITIEGYPILPKVIAEKELNKIVSERILREYLSRHYCECTNTFCSSDSYHNRSCNII